MSQLVSQVFTTHCEVCMGRSNWDILQDFYLRVETTENYARKLEKDLCNAQTTAHQCHNALAQCETSLSASWEILNEERLSHLASQEALTFESARQKETIALLERILKEAILSSEAADILGSWYTAAPKVAVYQATPRFEGFLTETAPTDRALTGNDISTSLGQQNEPTQRLLLSSPTPGSHQLDERESQTTNRVCSTEMSNNNQKNCSRSARSIQSATSRTQNLSDGTEPTQLTESRKMTQNGVRGSPLRITQFPGR